MLHTVLAAVDMECDPASHSSMVEECFISDADLPVHAVRAPGS